MRLLNARTKGLESFPESDLPDYAILSHTWGDGEVLYQDMENLEYASTLRAFPKLEGACRQSITDGWTYIWVDTCCINKDSSSELSEAINSMFLWYQNAQVCYAYLADVPSDEDPTAKDSSFSTARWFSRGWTLQELLAPSFVIFYGKDWCEIGTKASLREVISSITGIESAVILSKHAAEVSIAKRMSWAATRQTAREEDIAYCLMGLFGVNMPMIYGEGRNAFTRLQQEIMKLSDDQTLFAWKSVTGSDRGLLAHSPAEFFDSKHIVKTDDVDEDNSHYAMTNKGLQIELPLFPVKDSPDVFLAPLGCNPEDDTTHAVSIYLKKQKGNRYLRMHSHVLGRLSPEFERPTPSVVFVKENDPSIFDIARRPRPPSLSEYTVKFNLPEEYGYQISETYPPEFWGQETGQERVLSMKGIAVTGILRVESSKDHETFSVILGVHGHSFWSHIATDLGTETLQEIRDSYSETGKRRYEIWNNLNVDRVSRNVLQGLKVSVLIRKEQGKRYQAEIQVGSDKKANPPPVRFSRPEGVQYAFWVGLSEPRKYGFAVSERCPLEANNAYWVEDHDDLVLCMTGSGTSGVIVFKNPSTNDKIAIAIGFHNYEAWTAVAEEVGEDESAEEIRDSYYGTGRRNQVWIHRQNSFARLKGGMVATVVARTNNQADYKTDIIIGAKR